MVLHFQPLLKVLDFLPQSLYRHYALDSLAVVEPNLQDGASELIRANKQNPHSSLDIPKPCALIGIELLSEGKYESSEAGSFSTLDSPSLRYTLRMLDRVSVTGRIKPAGGQHERN